MSWKKRKEEWLPWYRRKTYKGGMTEDEKRQLDSFRMQEDHPAANSSGLPEEVQRYINRIECEVYDLKQDKETNTALFWSAVALMLIYYQYSTENMRFKTIFPIFIIVVVWINYWRQTKKNEEEFLPSDTTKPDPTDEGIKEEWEADCIVKTRQRDRDRRASGET